MIELDDGHRQALKLLSHNRKGCPQAVLLAHGVSGAVLDALVVRGMAVAQPSRLRIGSRERTVVWVKITRDCRRSPNDQTRAPPGSTDLPKPRHLVRAEPFRDTATTVSRGRCERDRPMANDGSRSQCHFRLAAAVMSTDNFAMKLAPHQLEPGSGNGLIGVVAMPVAV
jgi:hypothetical protein